MAAKIEAEQPTEAAYRPRSAKSSAHWPAIWRHCRASSRNCVRIRWRPPCRPAH